MRPLSRRSLLAASLLVGVAPMGAAAWAESRPPATAGVPMFRGNAARTGENPGPGPTGKPIARWQLRLGRVVSSSPVVVDGVIYVGSASPGTVEGGALHAVDAATGIERWRLATAPGDGIFTAPAVDAGVVIAGSYDGIVIGAAADTGEERWRFQAETAFVWSPAIVDGIAYLADTGGHLYALDAATGAERWRMVDGDGVERGFSSPAIAEGIVSFVSASRRPARPSYLVALDAITGDERWRFHAEGSRLVGNPVHAGGLVYATSREGPLYAVDAANGTQRRRYDLARVPWTSLALADGVAFFGTGTGELSALDLGTGDARWTRRVNEGAAITSGPVIAQGLLYAGDAEGLVLGVDAATGEERLRAKLGSLLSEPAVIGGELYVGSNSGALRAITGSENLPPHHTP